MSFAIENVKQNKMFFLDVWVIREDKIITTSVHFKFTFSGVYTIYYLRIILVLFTHSLTDASEFAQVVVNRFV